MVETFGSVSTIFIMIGIGYVLARKGILNDDTSKLFSKIVISVSIPLMIISSFPDTFTLEELMTSSTSVVVAFGSVIITYILSYIIAKTIKVNKKEIGLFCLLFTFSNTLFIGLPVNLSLFGEESTSYVLLYYLASTSLFWTLGLYNVKKHGENNENIGFIGKIKSIFTPPFISVIIGILLIVFNIDLPFFIKDSFQYMGSLLTPLSMLFIGTVIYNIDVKKIRMDPKTVMVLMGRFLISPLIVMVLLSFFSFPDMLNRVFIIETAAPIASSAGLIAQRYDVNPEFGGIMVGFTTLLYIFVIPIYAFIIG